MVYLHTHDKLELPKQENSKNNIFGIWYMATLHVNSFSIALVFESTMSSMLNIGALNCLDPKQGHVNFTRNEQVKKCKLW